MERTFAFVFARGGSKGLPGKNLRKIAGVPLVVHSIKTAQDLQNIEEIYVSTDCNRIADVSIRAGAKVIKRPKHLATDTASEWLAWQHAVEWVETKHGSFDRFLSLPPTAPCRSVEDVERCLQALTRDVDIVLTKTSSNRSPWFNMVVESSDRNLELVIKGTNLKRRQDSPDCFDITTVAYVARPSFIMKSNKIWDGIVKGVDVPAERAIDIDTSLDFSIAQFLKEQTMTRSRRNGND